MTTQGRLARAKHAAQSTVIDIGSSPEPSGRTGSASRTRATVSQTNVKGKGKATAKSSTRAGKMVMGPVIELTDSDSDSEHGPSASNGHNYRNDQAQAGSSRPKPFPMTIPQRSNSTLTVLPATSSLENIPVASGSCLQLKKRKASATAPPFLASQSDEENAPPVMDDVVPHKKAKVVEQDMNGQAADDEWDPEMQPYLLQFYEEYERDRKRMDAPAPADRVPVTLPAPHPMVPDFEHAVAQVPLPNPIPVPATAAAPLSQVASVHAVEPVILAEPQPEPNQDPTARTIAQILEIIPDVEPNYLRGLVDTHSPNFGAQTTEHILGLLFENGGYPRVDKSKGKRKVADEEVAEDNSDRPHKKVKVDYASIDRDPGSSVYYELALIHLQMSFPFVPKPFLRRMLEQHNKLYAPAHFAVTALEKAHVEARGDPYVFLQYIPKTTRYSPVKDLKKFKAASDKAFTEERRWLIEHLQDPTETKIGVVGTTIADAEQESSNKGKEKAAEEDAPLEDGTGIECQCCFSEYAFDKMVQCPETHLFCSSCVSQYAATKLGEHDPSIVCMHASGCALPFTESELRRVLSPKLMGLYERVKQQKEIQEAGLEGLEECPFCEWKCVLEASNEEEKLFRCGNEEGGCGVVSCRSCKKKDHLPKSCKEVEEDNVLDGRHVIEEAMTRALMRNCPKCHKAFVKETGCNKMTCPNCRTLSCYVCRQVINGYQHFDQTQPGQPTTSRAGGKCRLWDNVEERHAVEVRAAAEKAAAEYKRDHPDVNEEGIKVDLPVVPPPLPTIPGNRVFNAPGALLGVIPPPLPAAHVLPQFAARPMQQVIDAQAQLQRMQRYGQQMLADAQHRLIEQRPPARLRAPKQTRARAQERVQQRAEDHRLEQQQLIQQAEARHLARQRQHLQQQQQVEAHRLEQQRRQEQLRVELQAEGQAFLVQQQALQARQAERVQEAARLNMEYGRLQRQQLERARAHEVQAREQQIAQAAANVRLHADVARVQQQRAAQQLRIATAHQFAVPAAGNVQLAWDRVYEDALRRHNEERARRQ